jgi:hypothetical protein
MEERATSLGKPKFFYYMSPNNAAWLNASQAQEVEALGLGDHVVSDMHVGAGGGVEKATELFDKFPSMTMGAVSHSLPLFRAQHRPGCSLSPHASSGAWNDCAGQR